MARSWASVNTVHSCFERLRRPPRGTELFYRENDGLCGCVMAGCTKRNDHEGYQYFDYYIRDFDTIDKQGTVQERMGEMKVVKSPKWLDQQGAEEMSKGKYTAESTDEFALEWTGGGCNEWEKLGGRFLGAGHTVKGCFDICSKDTYWNGAQKKSLGKDVFFRGSDGMCGCVSAGCTKRADTPSYDHYVKAARSPSRAPTPPRRPCSPTERHSLPRPPRLAPVGHEPWGHRGRAAPRQQRRHNPFRHRGRAAPHQQRRHKPCGTAAGQHPTSSGGTNPAGTAAGQHPTKGGGAPAEALPEDWLKNTQNASYVEDPHSDNSEIIDADWLLANGRTMRENRKNEKNAKNLPPPWWDYVPEVPGVVDKEEALAPWVRVSTRMSREVLQQACRWVKNWPAQRRPP